MFVCKVCMRNCAHIRGLVECPLSRSRPTRARPRLGACTTAPRRTRRGSRCRRPSTTPTTSTVTACTSWTSSPRSALRASGSPRSASTRECPRTGSGRGSGIRGLPSGALDSPEQPAPLLGPPTRKISSPRRPTAAGSSPGAWPAGVRSSRGGRWGRRGGAAPRHGATVCGPSSPSSSAGRLDSRRSPAQA